VLVLIEELGRLPCVCQPFCDNFPRRAQHLSGIVPVVHQPITSLVETRHALIRSTVEPYGAFESVMTNLEALSAIGMFDLTKVFSDEVRGVGPGVSTVTQHCSTGYC